MSRTLASVALLLGLFTSSAGGEAPAFTVNPMMAKGPAGAAVTIVEFSDYQ
jgi:hypothetical protein